MLTSAGTIVLVFLPAKAICSDKVTRWPGDKEGVVSPLPCHLVTDKIRLPTGIRVRSGGSIVPFDPFANGQTSSSETIHRWHRHFCLCPYPHRQKCLCHLFLFLIFSK